MVANVTWKMGSDADAASLTPFGNLPAEIWLLRLPGVFGSGTARVILECYCILYRVQCSVDLLDVAPMILKLPDWHD